MWQGQFSDSLKINKMFNIPGEFTLELGDEITAVNGLDVHNFGEFLLAGQDVKNSVTYTVKRNGQLVQAQGPVPFPALVYQVQPRSAAIEAGILSGDVITHIDGQPIFGFADLQSLVAAADRDEMQFSVSGVLVQNLMSCYAQNLLQYRGLMEVLRAADWWA